MPSTRSTLNRRQFGQSLAAAAVALTMPALIRAQNKPGARWLLFTKSSGFEHAVIRRQGERQSFLAQHLAPVFEQRQIALMESKDGRLFEPEALKDFAGFVFYTSGDLTQAGTDGAPPMSPAGKQALLDAVASGVPFIGLHCAADTFRTDPPADTDPFIAMLGGEFESHGDQQPGRLRVVDPTLGGPEAQWQFTEEWYALRRLAADIRPVHILETQGMRGTMYEREPFALSWTREHGQGRVFYTGLGHREDVIASPAFTGLVGRALDWCRGA